MIKDSGTRREFGTGAVRDCADGKGRCDLLPLDVMHQDLFLLHINDYIEIGDTGYLKQALYEFIEDNFDSYETAILEVSVQYEEGAKKYTDDNWRKGIPLHCYIDSALRHYFKYQRGDDDERHDRAIVWNLLGALWTHKHRPDLADLRFAKKEADKVANKTTTERTVSKSAPPYQTIEISCDADESPIIAFDFDGTLFTLGNFPEIGEPNETVINWAKEFKRAGAILVLWTCREGAHLDMAIQACREQGLEFDYVNENVPEQNVKFGNDCRKIGAHLFIDDKSLHPSDLDKIDFIRWSPDFSGSEGTNWSIVLQKRAG